MDKKNRGSVEVVTRRGEVFRKTIQVLAPAGQRKNRASAEIIARPGNKKEGELSSRYSLWEKI